MIDDSSVSTAWEMRCPKCKRDDEIDISVKSWTRLVPDGTDRDEADETSEEWDNDSVCICRACGHKGTVETFQIEE